MRVALCRDARRIATTIVIAVVPIAILCAYVTNVLISHAPHQVQVAAPDIIPMAAIDESSTTIGIADSDLYNKSEAEIIESLDQMQALGVDTLRVVVAWAAIAPAEPGSALEVLYPENWDKIDFILSQAQERGMSVVAVLNATPYYGGQDDTGCLGCVGVAPDAEEFAAFAGEAAARFESLYPGVVSAYEVWNEPNAVTSWSPAVDPAAYTEVLKAVYTAIKDANGILGADPSDPLVVAGVLGAVISFGDLTMDPATFVQEMYANGAQGYFDALSYHPYNYDTPLSEQNPNYVSPLQMLLEVRQTMLEYGDDDIKIWATEYGLPTSLVSYEEQADFIEDFLTTWANGLSEEQLAQLPDEYQELVDTWEEWIGPAFIYTLWDRLGEEDTEQGSLGIFYYDEETGEWEMKPAAQVIKDLLESETPDDGEDLATALAASLQKLVEQVANSVSVAVQTAVVPAVTQSLQQVGAQIGNALANALAAWAASLKNSAPTTASSVAVVESIDTTAVANPAVVEAVSPAEPDVLATADEVGSAEPVETAETSTAITAEETLSSDSSAETTAAEEAEPSAESEATAAGTGEEHQDQSDQEPQNQQGEDDAADPDTTTTATRPEGNADNDNSESETETTVGDGTTQSETADATADSESDSESASSDAA